MATKGGIRRLTLAVGVLSLLSLLLLLRMSPTTTDAPSNAPSMATPTATPSTNAPTRPSVVGTRPPTSITSPAMEALYESIMSDDSNRTIATITQQDIDAYCNHHRERVWKRLRTSFKGTALLLRLERQRELHERVARGEAPPDQKYLVWSLSGGLGNRFLSLTSTFVAAMLANRVFLMKDWFTPLPPGWVKSKPVIIPNPSTEEYFLEDLSKLFGEGDRWPRNDQLLCPLLPMMSLRDYAKLYPGDFRPEKNSDHAKVDIAARHDKTFRRWNRFLCSPFHGRGDEPHAPPRSRRSNESHADFFPEKFVYVWTNQYYLPALYANPFHAAEMKAMFPSGKPYQDLVSLLVIPSLPVVARLRRFFESEARSGGIRLTGSTSEYDSLQIRPFRTKEILPLANDFESCFVKARDKGSDKPFFLASMFTEIRQHFHHHFGQTAVRTMSSATEFQLTSNATADQEALTDMMILAFAKRLFVSPGSTFGMFVAAFAQRSPIAVREHGACREMGSAEPCFGSWFRRDHLLRRTMAKPPTFSCRAAIVPSSVINCEQS